MPRDGRAGLATSVSAPLLAAATRMAWSSAPTGPSRTIGLCPQVFWPELAQDEDDVQRYSGRLKTLMPPSTTDMVTSRGGQDRCLMLDCHH